MTGVFSSCLVPGLAHYYDNSTQHEDINLCAGDIMLELSTVTQPSWKKQAETRPTGFSSGNLIKVTSFFPEGRRATVLLSTASAAVKRKKRD